MSRILIVSNRLPITISGLPGKLQLKRSNGGVATALTSVLNDHEALWLGWTGTSTRLSRLQLRLLGADKRLRPVHIPARQVRRYYDNFSNGVLWPILHGFKATIKPTAADWQAYQAVNQRFADAVARICKPDDIIWVHDYHLLLVPGMLRQAGITNRIGFFLHTPFANNTCIKPIAQHDQLLRSLAQVNLLGLHTPRDVASCQQAFKECAITMRQGSQIQDIPIGVDFAAYQGAAQNRKVRRFIDQAVAQVQDKQIILSISRLDYTKGIPQQLRAFEQLLKQHPRAQELLYKLIVAPSREDAAGYQELKTDIERLVTRINTRYGTAHHRPIDYTYRNCGFEEVSAWYLLADVLLVTPVIDGMNLVVKEFIATRTDTQSMLVISNTIGAAHQLDQALQVDPADVPAIAGALHAALDMPPEERLPRWKALRRSVRQQDVYWWVQSILDTLGAMPHAVLTAEMLHLPRLHLGKRLPAPALLRLASSKN